MVVHGPYPLNEPRVLRETRAALEGGYDVDVVAMQLPGESRHENVDGAWVYRLPVRRSRRSSPRDLVYEYGGFTARATMHVARFHIARRYDVVQIHNPPDFLVASALLPRLTGAKVIFDVHDLAPELLAIRMGTGRGPKTVERVLRVVEKAAMSLADVVVTVSEPYRGELLKRGVRPQKIVVVLNALDETLIPSEPAAPERDVFRMVYHGTLTWHYGVHLVVDALAAVAERIPHARLEIYGDGDALGDIRTRIDRHGLADRVSLSGRALPQDEVLRRVAGASVGIVSQLPIERNDSALPTKLLEYVALGVPIVAPAVPAIRQSFTEEEAVFFRGGDVESLGAALCVVADDPDSSHARAMAALKHYRAEYRWPIYARRYVELLGRLTE